MKKFFSWTLALGLLTTATLPGAAQTVLVGTGTPNASAALDVQSTNQGMLVPRLTASQRTAIANAATGLLVYQTDAPAGFYVYSGTAWTAVGGAGTTGATGPAGPTGPAGAMGATGATGPGVPTGGTAGQVLSKIDATNYNTQWTTPATGGGGVSSQLYATSTLSQTKTSYAYNRYAFTFNNSVSGANTAAFTNGNTYTVPTGQGGLYSINTAMLITAYSGYTSPIPVPEIQVTSGGSVRYYYGVGVFSSQFSGDGNEGTAVGSQTAPYSYGRGSSDFIIPLLPGDMVKVFFRLNLSATSSSFSVTFSSDGSSYLSIVKLN